LTPTKAHEANFEEINNSAPQMKEESKQDTLMPGGLSLSVG
jgi:hypothetical protein